MKLKPGLGIFYAVWPGNRWSLFYMYSSQGPAWFNIRDMREIL